MSSRNAHPRAQFGLREFLLYLFVMITTQLFGCGSNGEPSASGQLLLQYLEASDTVVSLRLTNGSNRTISIRGSWTMSIAIRTLQADSQVECESTPTGKTEVELPGFFHGKSRIFAISQGEAVTLDVPTELPGRYRGGVCKLSLTLQDGSTVGPVQFSP
jgi:hypothetical protein